MTEIGSIQKANPLNTALNGVKESARELADAASAISSPEKPVEAEDAVRFKIAQTDYKAQVKALGAVMDTEKELLDQIAPLNERA